MLVLLILPLRANTLLEEMVVGLKRQFGGGGNVILGKAVKRVQLFKFM